MSLLKFSLLFPLLFLFQIAGYAQEYWQQRVDHSIEAELNPATHTVTARQLINYFNNSPDTLHFIYLHIWPNAYKNDHTAFSEQLLLNNRLDFYFSKEEDRGYINRLQFTVNNEILEWQEDSLHQDFGKLFLQHPLAPGDSLRILNSFQVKLPYLFSRSGHKNGFYAITQWYPKPAVYDSAGWHPMPYLDQGEYYNEFGNYRVAITVPEDFIIAATGNRELQSSGTKEDNKQVLRFQQDNCTDFAWFASRDFQTKTDKLLLPSGKEVKLEVVVRKQQEAYWANSIDFLKQALLTRSSWLGDYPYSTMTVVDGIQGPGSGGMEYPTITVLNEIRNQEELDLLIAHETGHNWFGLAIANNERRIPWLDEGLNTFYDNRYKQLRYPESSRKTKFPFNRFPDNFSRALIAGLESIREDQSPNLASEDLTSFNYGLMVYEKTAIQLEELEASLGSNRFDSSMRRYVAERQFRHADSRDFKKIIALQSPFPSDRHIVTDSGRRLKPVFLFSSKQPEKFHYLGIGPALGYNQYDGLLAGAFVHNYQLPLSRFRFFIAPTYGIASRQWGGIGTLNYHLPGSGTGYQSALGIHEWVLGASFMKVTMDAFTAGNTDLQFNVLKFAPYLKINFVKPSALSKTASFLTFTSYFFREQFLETRMVIDGSDTSYIDGIKAVGRNLQQLRFFHANHRILYPYSLDGRVEMGNSFTRLSVDARYFLNYPKPEGGGLQIRFFAGKFFSQGANNAEKQLANSRYYLNMTGANGFEDYTYSNYFAGRNEFTGWQSQQIMIRDGGFKVRTDLLSNKIGRSDNWLTALNLTASIPNNLNPLQKLPVKIPIKLFLDIGTYSGAWEENQEDGRFLMDAGLQLSFLRNLVNLYIPVVNSKVFRNYHQSTLGEKKFWKTLSFSVDIQNLSARKWLMTQVP